MKFLHTAWYFFLLGFITPVLGTADTIAVPTQNDSLLLQKLIKHIQEAQQLESMLVYHSGHISLRGPFALDLSSGYKYLPPEEAKKILEQAWGNPPRPTLGMVFPDSVNPYLFDGWGVVVSYIEEGYIDDLGTYQVDPDQLLQVLKEDALARKVVRSKQGYDGYEVIGWAEPPIYDPENKVLIWAKEAKFDGALYHTLNYDVRILGRRGYISLNAVATMDQLPWVKATMYTLKNCVAFNNTDQYTAFDPDTDQTADYGLESLVTGQHHHAGGSSPFFQFIQHTWKLILIGMFGCFALATTLLYQYFPPLSKK